MIRLVKKQIRSVLRRTAFLLGLALIPAANAGLVCRQAPDLTTTVQEPVEVRTLSNGHTLVDFGKNAAGWLQFDAPQTGDYKIFVSEALGNVAEGSIYTDLKGSTYTTPWMNAAKDGDFKDLDVRTLVVATNVTAIGTHRVPFVLPWQKSLNSTAHAKPTVNIGTIMPFRYVEIVTPPPGIRPEDFRRVMVHYPFDWNESSFTCDNANLNKVYDFCKWSIYAASYLGYWVDGDRERRIYSADEWIEGLSSFAAFSDPKVTRRSTQEQLDDGYKWVTQNYVEWHLFMPMLCYMDWMYTGDRTTLEKNFTTEKMLKDDGEANGWLLAERQREDGLIVMGNEWVSSIIDWPQDYRYGYDCKTTFEKTAGRMMPIENAQKYAQCRMIAEMATALGKTAEAERYTAMADSIYTAYNDVFFDAAAGLYVDKVTTNGYRSTHHSLQANAAALEYGLVPEDKRDYVLDFVATNSTGNLGMSCSPYFAQHLLEALMKYGRGRQAIALMTNEKINSWMHMMEEGWTMTTEGWYNNTDDLDLTHAWTTAPLNIIARYVLGVRPKTAGFAEALVQPNFGDLKTAHGVVPTLKGGVEVDYQNRTLTVTVPAGMAAEVTFAGQTKTVTANAAMRTVTIGEAAPVKPWAGKKVSILGDSYSSFQGSTGSSTCYYYPEDYGTLPKAEYIRIPQSGMWWAQVIDHFGGELSVNSSVGGSPMTTCCTAQNFYQRVSSKTNLLGSPDVIFVFGGMNDHWMPGNTLSTEGKFEAGIQTLFDYLKTNYASAKVYVILNKEHTGSSWTQWGITAMQRSVLSAQAASHGFSTIDLQGHFSTENADLNQGSYPHATAQGQTKIANRVISVIEAGGEEPVPTHKHTLGPWQLKTPPTCTESGVSNRVCTAADCDKSAGWQESAIAPKLGHDFRDDWAVDLDDATKEIRYCHRDGCTATETRAKAEPVDPDPPTSGGLTTNAMETASWGYEIHGLGTAGNEVALVYTNAADDVNMFWPVPAGVISFDFLVVGGGGGGSRSGAGAGGVVTGKVAVVSAEPYVITVGAGGASGGGTGGDSAFGVGEIDWVRAYGGAGGVASKTAGASGGCGSGAATRGGTAGAATQGEFDGSLVSAAEKFGCAGGTSDVVYGSAGGGGATEVGKEGSNASGNKGGDGLESFITGESVWYAGGGTGGGNNHYGVENLGGKGGGGRGGVNADKAEASLISYYRAGGDGVDGLGGGGGGVYTGSASGRGGSGVVIIRYALGDAPEPSENLVVPGDSSKAYDSKDAAEAAKPKTVTPPEDVAKALAANPEALANYVACFTVATRPQGDKWVNVAELKPEVEDELQQQVDNGAAKVVEELSGDTVTLDPVTPGFRYALEYGEGLGELALQTFEIATENRLSLSLPKGATSGFYRVIVRETE